MVATADLLPMLEEGRAWGARLLGGPILFFPIRHHSPACAWHLRRLFELRRPGLVLIEGPARFNTLVPLLASPEAVPPLAVYSHCTLRSETQHTSDSPGDRPERRGAYYPFASFSPEWVALRTAVASGVEVRFIDLDFDAQAIVDESDRLSGRMATLLSETWFQRSAYLRALATQLRCRDTDELWDRLFESWARSLDTETFVSQVATYCDLARRGVSDEEHARDGTSSREQEMAWHIGEAAREYPGRTVLVITGGYHSVALPRLVGQVKARPKVDRKAVISSEVILLRYSFDRLDRINGYGAGMPSPAYYQLLWDDPADGAGVSLSALAAIAERARRSGPDLAPSTASLLAALEHTLRLSRIRGNRIPTRSDLLDGIESCLLQGTVGLSGHGLGAITQAILSGTRVGQVPAAAGLPPIVADFYEQARAFRLKVEDTEDHELALDVYSNPRSRAVSRLFHRLRFLEIPFAEFRSGPNFTGAQLGQRLREVWEYRWAPQTESALIDAAARGSTVEEAVGQLFSERLGTPDVNPHSAAVAAERLSEACLLGLRAVVPQLLEWLGRCVREDPEFDSVGRAVHRLALLWQAREPLEALGLEQVPALARTAFERSTFLVPSLGRTPTENADEVAKVMVSLRELLVGTVAEWFDADLLWVALDHLLREVTGTPTVLGAAAGMLYSDGRIGDRELGRFLEVRTAPGSDLRGGIGFLRGVLLAARELLWQSPVVLQALRSVVESRDQIAFVRALPELRLALAVLTPAETDRLAQNVAEALGMARLGPTIEYQVSEHEVQANLEVSVRLREVLRRDSLAGWVD